MEDLIGDAAEADADFWGQSAWQELSDDENIVSEEYDSEEKQDVEDEDFDDVDEEIEQRERIEMAIEHEEQAVKQTRNESNKRKKGIYVDPALKTRNTTKKKTSQNYPVPVSSRVIRASTTSKSFHVEEYVHRAKKIKPPEFRFTQQELLEEAAKTEIENRKSLALMLMLQEEGKREKQASEKQNEKRILYFSSARQLPTGGVINTISFTQVKEVPCIINAVALPPPERPICSVTGLPAKYRDPQTGIPFRTIEAFKVIRGYKDN